MLARLMTFWLVFAAGPVWAAGGTLVVVNQKLHRVEMVDVSSGKEVAVVTVGVNGHEVALSKDGRLAYVPIYSNVGVGKVGTNGQTIDVVDLKERRVAASIDLGHPVRPHKDVLGKDGLLYVTAELDDAVDVVDVKAMKVMGQIPTGAKESHILGISPDGKTGYTANVDAGSVSVLDIPGRKLVKVIPLTKRVQRIAFSKDGRWVFTSDWDEPRVAVIDTKTNELSRWVPVEGTPYVTEATPDGRWLLVSAAKDGKGLLNVVDLKTMAVVRTIPVESLVSSFAEHDGLIYMSCAGNGRVEVLQPGNSAPGTWTLLPGIQLEPGIDGMAWTEAVK